MTTDPQWSPCEPGTLDSLKQPHGASMTRRGVLAAAVVAAAGGGVLLFRAKEAAGIACTEVMQLGQQYVNGELAVELSDRIDMHRDHCPSCDEHLVELEQRRDQRV